MKRLSINQKIEALQNGLITYKFPKKYFVSTADKRCGERFAIASKSESGGINIHSNFMSYEGFNAYLLGYYDAKMKKL